MQTLFSIPAGLFLVLWGLIWEPQPKTKKDHKTEQLLIEAGVDIPEQLTREQMINYLRRVAVRVLLVLIGLIGIVAGISQMGSVADSGALMLLLGLYAGVLIVVQRAEKNRRLLVFFFMAFSGLLIWRTAEYRNVPDENDWAMLGAVALNLVFWLVIGRRFPPGTSDSIEVIGME